MKSPFTSPSACVIESFNNIKIEDDEVLTRRKYIRLQLRIHKQLSSTKSFEKISKNKTKINLHNGAGILMVEQKKPFNVKFDLDRN